MKNAHTIGHETATDLYRGMGVPFFRDSERLSHTVVRRHHTLFR